MEVAVYEVEHCLLVVGNLLTQRAVAVGAQTTDDAVNHGGAEYMMRLEDGTLLLQAVGRSLATVGQLCQTAQLVGMLLLVDIDIDISCLGHLQCIFHLETVTAGNGREPLRCGETLLVAAECTDICVEGRVSLLAVYVP